MLTKSKTIQYPDGYNNCPCTYHGKVQLTLISSTPRTWQPFISSPSPTKPSYRSLGSPSPACLAMSSPLVDVAQRSPGIGALPPISIAVTLTAAYLSLLRTWQATLRIRNCVALSTVWMIPDLVAIPTLFLLTPLCSVVAKRSRGDPKQQQDLESGPAKAPFSSPKTGSSTRALRLDFRPCHCRSRVHVPHPATPSQTTVISLKAHPPLLPSPHASPGHPGLWHIVDPIVPSADHLHPRLSSAS
jgi:hypothetical protein